MKLERNTFFNINSLLTLWIGEETDKVWMESIDSSNVIKKYLYLPTIVNS